MYSGSMSVPDNKSFNGINSILIILYNNLATKMGSEQTRASALFITRNLSFAQ